MLLAETFRLPMPMFGLARLIAATPPAPNVSYRMPSVASTAIPAGVAGVVLTAVSPVTAWLV